MAIASPGLGSGLDVNSIISNLMQLERQPMVQLQQKESSYRSKLSALGTVKSSLSTFKSSLSDLKSPSVFTSRKTTVGDDTTYTATASSTASAGSYNIRVDTLAAAHSVATGEFTSTTDTVGTGSLTFQFGTYSGGTFSPNGDKAAQTITIASGQNTLAGIRDAVNAADAGVTASIVNNGSGERLVFSSTDSGTENSLKITVDDDDATDTDTSGLSQLAYDPEASAGSGKNLSQTVAAADATLNINGIDITKSSNTVTDAISGVTLNLLKTNASTVSLKVEVDSDTIKEKVEAFVSAYNTLSTTLKDMSSYDADTKIAGPLNGDSTVFAIRNQLRNILNTSLSTAGGGLTTLSDAGVTFQRDGTLALDSSRLNETLADPTKDLSTLFAAVGKPTDSRVSYLGSSSSTLAGSYAVSITQYATQGQVTGSASLGASTVITTGVNDTLQLTVNGTSATVTLAAGTYSQTDLAAEVQSKVNGASALSDAGAAVSVSVSGNAMIVKSAAYGSSSTISIDGGTSQTTLFGGTIDTSLAAGVNVAGTINGVAATGSGQSLLSSTGDSTGLNLKIIGSGTIVGSVDMGTVAFARGYADQLYTYADDILDIEGVIAGREEGINSLIKTVGNQITAWESRLETIETRYRAQYAALDTMIASMSQTSSYLSQQLASLPGAG